MHLSYHFIVCALFMSILSTAYPDPRYQANDLYIRRAFPKGTSGPSLAERGIYPRAPPRSSQAAGSSKTVYDFKTPRASTLPRFLPGIEITSPNRLILSVGFNEAGLTHAEVEGFIQFMSQRLGGNISVKHGWIDMQSTDPGTDAHGGFVERHPVTGAPGPTARWYEPSPSGSPPPSPPRVSGNGPFLNVRYQGWNWLHFRG